MVARKIDMSKLTEEEKARLQVLYSRVQTMGDKEMPMLPDNASVDKEKLEADFRKINGLGDDVPVKCWEDGSCQRGDIDRKSIDTSKISSEDYSRLQELRRRSAPNGVVDLENLSDDDKAYLKGMFGKMSKGRSK